MAKKLVFLICTVAAGLFLLSGCTASEKAKIEKTKLEKAKVGEAKSKGVKVKYEPIEVAKLEVRLEEPKTQKLVLRVNCGATEPYTDKAGKVWLSDQYLESGKDWGVADGMTVERGELNIAGTDSPKIYETERYSMTAYKFTVPNGKYSVRLHFAETFDGISGEGQRVFSVSINDKIVLKDLDLYKEAGGPQKPLVKEFKNISVTNKELVIGFTSNIENPEINGIEILSE